MTYAYMVCAVVGGTILFCQFVLTLLGLSDDLVPDDIPHDSDVGHFDGHHGSDHEHHHGSTWLFGVITFRTVVAALTFFGLTGLATSSSGFPRFTGLLLAIVAGGGSMYAVHWMMLALHKLRADGTARIDRAVGTVGTVYLRIPGHNGGAGKIHLNLQNRTVEYDALTAEDDLPAGARVVVTGIVGPDTVTVARVPETQGVAHV
ncbi:MAG: NfeD family protein [Planctomycetes bacterium]|nr:NfeD family protein [Planctomycetota bacterium]